MKRTFHAALFFAALLGLWHAVVQSELVNPVLIPSPLNVGRYLVGALGDGTMFEALWVTMRRLLLGYFIGIILGVPLGLLTARFRSCFAARRDVRRTRATSSTSTPACWSAPRASMTRTAAAP